MKALLVILVAGLVAFGVVTGWALESGGVAVVETRAPDGSLRSTHVWYVEPDGELWIEAGTPENDWYVDVQRDPRVAFSADARSGRYVAKHIDEPGAHDEIRARLCEKYGVRDRWVGLLVDTSRSVAMRLVPARDERE